MRDLIDYVVITDPIILPELLREIMMMLDGVTWRTPADMGYKRDCTTFPVSAAAAGQYPSPDIERVKFVDARLVDVTMVGLRIYRELHPDLHTVSDQGFDILRYDTGQLIDYHADDNQPRVLSMSIGLNDDYEGGEFRFWRDDRVRIRLGAGRILMFPPNFMYPHEILPITRGTRYSMITWFV